MKIGLLIYGSLDTLSGGYYYDRMLVEYLRNHGEQVEIISLPWRNYPKHLTDNFYFRLPANLDVLIQDELNHPSLINANKREHTYPILSLVHHLRYSEEHPAYIRWLYKWVEKAYLNSVDGFIFNSNTTRAVVENISGRHLPQVVAYPPTDRFGKGLSAEQVHKRCNESGPLRLVFLGNVIPRKGLHTLLGAVAKTKDLVSLDVIGSLEADAVYAKKMQQQALSPGRKNHVTFHGKLNNEDLTQLLARAHVLVVPSSYEGFGIVYLEGMAFGLPAIGTTAGAAHEMITDGGNGYLITPGDEHALAEKLTTLHEDRTLLTHLSLEALRRYAQQPTWEQTAASIHQFLYQIQRNQIR